MADITRKEGVTASEWYLQRLCERSFLRFWSYAGVYRDQGKQHGKGDGRELCDLLVVFGNHILLFSDKDCAYPDSGNPETDWKRWYRKAVRKSADQLWGAEGQVRDHPDSLYLDAACTRHFPFPLPDSAEAKIHRIAIAHGAAERCRAQFGGSGSLMLNTDIVGDSQAFTIGQIDPAKGFVHVLDDTTLDIIINTLDTITDFVEYLTRKEHFLTGIRAAFIPGEEDLLAYYLQHTDSRGEHFMTPDGSTRLETYDAVMIPEGLWETFSRHKQRLAQIDANQVSYSWDRLIEKFAHHIQSGTQYYSTHPDMASSERALRFLAREPRTRRRMLARGLIEVLKSVPKSATGSSRYSRIIPASRAGDPHYVFLAMSAPSDIAEAEYREGRRNMLEAHCWVTKLVFPEAQDIVGIATEPWAEAKDLRSEDVVYLDAREWNEDMQAEAERLQRDLGILTQLSRHPWRESEYPPLAPKQLPTAEHKQERPRRVLSMTRRMRNAQCPCGSGKQFKRCCGLHPKKR